MILILRSNKYEKEKILLCVLSIALTVFISACDKEKVSTLQIAITAENCSACYFSAGRNIEVPGLKTRRMEVDGTWSEWVCSYIPYRIERFKYSEGYEYELLIQKTEPKIDNSIMDGPDASYSLIKIISMTSANVSKEE